MLKESYDRIQTLAQAIEEKLQGKDPGSESWTDEDQADLQQFVNLKHRYLRTGLLRIKLEAERAVWREDLLDRYRAVVETQRIADRDLEKFLRGRGLLDFSKDNFIKTWRGFPPQYRESRRLEKNFGRHVLNRDVNGSDDGIPKDMIRTLLHREKASRFDAALEYEAARIDLDVAMDRFNEYAWQTEEIEEKYKCAFLAGKNVPTP